MSLPPDRPHLSAPPARRNRWMLPAAIIAAELVIIALILLTRGPGGVALLARDTPAPTVPPESPLQTLEARVPRRYLPEAIGPGVYFLDGTGTVDGQARAFRAIFGFLDRPHCIAHAALEIECARVDDQTVAYGSQSLHVVKTVDDRIQVDLGGRKAYLTKIGEDTATGNFRQDVLGKWSCPILDDGSLTTNVFALEIRQDGEVWISNEAGERERMGRLEGEKIAMESVTGTQEPAELIPMGEFLFLTSQTESGFGCARQK